MFFRWLMLLQLPQFPKFCRHALQQGPTCTLASESFQLLPSSAQCFQKSCWTCFSMMPGDGGVFHSFPFKLKLQVEATSPVQVHHSALRFKAVEVSCGSDKRC